MNINEYKQLDTMILDETNVKELVREVAETEKGVLALVFSKQNQEYYFTLAGQRLLRPMPKLERHIVNILESSYRCR